MRLNVTDYKSARASGRGKVTGPRIPSVRASGDDATGGVLPNVERVQG